jgi:exopolyphosphatase / guanosine-5'-triphosphate,3'-diphosphate pyrophosphatase
MAFFYSPGSLRQAAAPYAKPGLVMGGDEMGRSSRRAAVLDIGCFSAHLLVVERSPSRRVSSHKTRLRLDRAIDATGGISGRGVDEIAAAVATAARRLWTTPGVPFLPFATSSIRDATNAREVVAAVAARTGLILTFFSGTTEAEFAYRAARRWARPDGPLTMLDVGGGTLEIAHGHGPRPSFTRSLPLGARTLSRDGLVENLAQVRSLLPQRIADVLPPEVRRELTQAPAIGCSKVFESLAKLTGARRLHAEDIAAWIPRLAAMPARRRARLPGISRHRAHQALAGAVAAEALMTATCHEVIDISPWSTREGVLIDMLEQDHD